MTPPGLSITRQRRLGGGIGPSYGELMNASRRLLAQEYGAVIDAVDSYAPLGRTGNTRRWLKAGKDGHPARVRVDGDGLVLEVGDLENLRINVPAPPDTIRNYIALYYNRRARQSRPWVQAWYNLRFVDKSQLAGARASGNTSVGGPHPPPTYIGSVNSGRVLITLPQGTSAYAKQARYRGFLDRIVAAVLTAVYIATGGFDV